MITESNTISEKKNLEFKLVDNIAVLYVKNNIFDMIVDIKESSQFFSLLDKSKNNRSIHAMLIVTENGCLSSEKYREFLKMVNESSNQDGYDLQTGIKRTRQIVSLNNFIRRAVGFEKPIITAFQGEIATPFLGASLAADYRCYIFNVSC